MIAGSSRQPTVSSYSPIIRVACAAAGGAARRSPRAAVQGRTDATTAVWNRFKVPSPSVSDATLRYLVYGTDVMRPPLARETRGAKWSVPTHPVIIHSSWNLLQKSRLVIRHTRRRGPTPTRPKPRWQTDLGGEAFVCLNL